MSRPVAHNKVSEPINGSIVNGDDVGNIVYTVDGEGNDYPGGYADRLWVPSADGAAPIVFVTDTFTQGYTGDPAEAVPIFFACNGTSSAAITYTANRLPGMSGQNFTTIGEALEYVTRNGYFILEGNDPFQGINADSLALDLDAAKMSSYPQTSTSWYDLSGNQNTGTLTNGPTFVLSSGSFFLDGIDDYIQVNNNNGFGTVGAAPVGTLSFTANLQRKSGGGTQYQQVAGFRNGSTFEFFFLLLDASGATVNTEARLKTTAGVYDVNVGFTSYFDKWTRVDFVANSNRSDLYFNGNLVGSNTSVAGTFGATSGNFRIGLSPAGAYPTKGQIQDTRFYTRALSQAEVKQNYFGSPIVTDGLVFAVDANNIVSYPKSGTSWYNLTGSIVSGSLVNGPTFDQVNGGSIVFDGVDDYAITSNFPQLSNWSTEIWLNPNVYTTSQKVILDINLGIRFEISNGYFNSHFGDGSGWIYTNLPSTTPIAANTWFHVVVTVQSGGQAKVYVNGILENTINIGSGTTPNVPLYIARFTGATGYEFNGKIANTRIYNKALSAAEVLQNYQAEQYRFVTSPGIPTNGLILHLDAANRQSYPGSGTVWYDISGQGANADLLNGVAYNSAGYFFFDGADDIANSINISQDYRDLVIGIWSESDGGLEMVFSLYGGVDASLRLSSNVLNTGGGNNDDWQFGSSDLVFIDGTYNDTTNLGSQFHFLRTYRSNEVDFGTSFRYSLSSTFLSRYFKGKIAFVLAYNRQLSDAEVQGLYYHYKDRFGF